MSTPARNRLLRASLDEDDQIDIFMRLPLSHEQRLAVLKELLLEKRALRRSTPVEDDETKEPEQVE
jgi:hypothetical protein